MTTAQKRNREVARKVEVTDRWFRFFLCSTALLLAVFAGLTYVQVLNVNARLEQQVKDSRHNTEQAIKSVEEENKRAHEKQNAFLKCIILLQREERTSESIDGCSDAANGKVTATPTNTTAPAPAPSVTNPTQSPTPPEQTQPTVTQEQTTSVPPEPKNGLFTIIDKVLQLGQK